MKIRNKLTFGFISIIFLLVFISGTSLYIIKKQTEVLVYHAVENLAKSIVLSLVTVDEEANTLPLYSNRQRLQDFISDFNRIEKYDISVVDVNQKVLGSVNPEKIGTIFNYDVNDEVGKTIRDGITRTFIERNAEHPKGAYSIVVPLKPENEDIISGAVILDYTSLLDSVNKIQTQNHVTTLIIVIIIILFGLAITYIISKSIAVPITRLHQAAVQISQGDLSSKIEMRYRDDELSELARAFETMQTSLKDTFRKLETEINERKKAEETVQQTNVQLAERTNELEHRNREIGLLSDMDNMLQSSLTLEEAYTTITYFGEKLFPEDAGAVYLFRASRNILEMVATWGKPLFSEKFFAPEECIALRRGQKYLVNDKSMAQFCPHVRRSEVISCYLCIPMMGHGETLGILYLQGCMDNEKPKENTPQANLQAQKFSLATNVAEHLSLILSNLKLRDTLKNLSLKDALTGLYNHRYLKESLEREVMRATRTGKLLGVIMLDIDHFKQFNDTYGHETGDILLRELGIYFQKHMRGSDIVCRYGGEEFTIIMPESSVENTLKRAESIRQGTLSIQIKIHGLLLPPVTISIGVATFPNNGKTGEEVLRAADLALYQAKEKGRNRVEVAEKKNNSE